MLELYRPSLDELWFRKRLLEDPETMSYNRAWGGTIPFPESGWPGWYDRWVAHNENKRFFRYLRNTETGDFVGEVAYHFDERLRVWLADVLVAACHRKKGYGTEALRLLCESAAANGIAVLRDNIAAGNPALSLFLKAGFTEEYRTDEYIMLEKRLHPEP